MLLAGEKESAPRARPEIEVPAAWLRLALDAGSADFCDKLLALLLDHAGASRGGLWLLARTSRGQGLNLKSGRDIPQGDAAWTAWLGERVRELIAARKAIAVPPPPGDAEWSEPGACTFIPLAWDGAGLGVAMLAGATVSLPAANWLGTLAGWALHLHLRSGPRHETPADEKACTEALLASAHSAEWPGVLAAHLRRQSGAGRVSLLQRRRDRWQVAAVSGAGEVKRRSAEARAIEQEFGRLVASGQSAAHRERTTMSLHFGAASGWGALLEFEPGHVAREEQVLRGLAGLIRVGERVLPQVHTPGWRLTVARALTERPAAAGPRGSRWVLAGMGLLLVLLALLPVRERFEGDCELQPAARYTVVAEVEGRVKRVAATEGALVKAGETLAELDASTFATRLEVAREQRQEQEAEARRQQGLQDMTAYRMARLKAEQSAQEEASLQEDIRRTTLTAPIDGKILSKDLLQKQGTVLRLGDTLCEIGGLEGWNLQIAVPEDDLEAFLQALARRGNLPVTYRLKAGSTFILPAAVTSPRQVSEMAYPVEGRNVVYVTISGVAIPPELLRDLRPGFSGRAKIEGERHPLAVTLTRRAGQWLRLHWWL